MEIWEATIKLVPNMVLDIVMLNAHMILSSSKVLQMLKAGSHHLLTKMLELVNTVAAVLRWISGKLTRFHLLILPIHVTSLDKRNAKVLTAVIMMAIDSMASATKTAVISTHIELMSKTSTVQE